MSGQHSVLSPSSAHRRVRCPGSLAACKGMPNESSEYAAEGTAYHEVAAEVLRGDTAACNGYIGRIIEADGYAFTVDEENAAHAQVYVDAIRRLPGSLMVEVKLDTSPVVGVPGQGGTGDAIVLDYEHATIHVNDLKFGRGEVVYCKGNEQLIEYGAAALEMFDMLADWRHVSLAIHQPRVGHYDEHTYTVDELRLLVASMRPREQLAYRLWENGAPEEIQAAMFPGEKQCRWCPLKGTCAARANYMMDQFPLDAPLVLGTMTDAELAYARNRVADMQHWCADIEAEAMRRALAGAHLPGWKLVDGRKGNRKWLDESAAIVGMVEVIGDAAYQPKKIISPADAEKKLKKHPETWNLLQLFIGQADGAKALVKDEDPRPVVAVTPVEFGLDAPT